jgi:hypothetical protein
VACRTRPRGGLLLDYGCVTNRPALPCVTCPVSGARETVIGASCLLQGMDVRAMQLCSPLKKSPTVRLSGARLARFDVNILPI